MGGPQRGARPGVPGRVPHRLGHDAPSATRRSRERPTWTSRCVIAEHAADGHRGRSPPGKRLVDGVLVDVSYRRRRRVADPARVAASFVYAPSFRGGQVLADPTGQLGRLEAAIAPGFASPAAVRARTDDVHRRIRARLTALDPAAPWPELVLAWLFPTSLTAVRALVAALRTPTVRLRYLRAREVTAARRVRAAARRSWAVPTDRAGERHLVAGRISNGA